MTYRFPQSLEMLGLYLRQKGAEVDNLRSARHALDVLKRETGFKFRFPRHHESCSPRMRQIHKQLFPNVEILPINRRKQKTPDGTFGPASRVRSVSQEVWEAVEAEHCIKKQG